MTYLNKAHATYANYLEAHNIPFIYRQVFLDYTDTFTGKRKRYYIDFVLTLDKPEWVEVIKSFKPTDKRIVAERRAAEAGIIYRHLNQQEIEYIKANT